jgi:glyoxylase-like metal-dependent hydrolase (beta-lactamase superfamily II)
MQQIHLIDVNFLSENTISVFLVPSSDGPVLIETGPASTFHHLEKAVNEIGYDLADIKHVFVTHIHFDHAGAAWRLAEAGATVYVHPVGAPHLVNPVKLWNSASKIYGTEMERLWGEIKPIDRSQVQEVNDEDVINIGNIRIKVWYTPGHAPHHNVYQLDDIIFTGDTAGIKIGNGPVQPPCPPPDVNIELWLTSIQKLKQLNPSALYLAHFGRHDRPGEILIQLEKALIDWRDWIKPYYEKNVPVEETIPAFELYARTQLAGAGLTGHEIQRYEYANPSFMSVTGLYRFWKLKSQGRI